MRRHNERLYRAARAILRDEREAEDVMQEAYVSAYAHLAQFDGRAKFSTWLTKIAVYEALARARRQGRYEPLDDSSLETLMPTMPSPDPERQAFGRELGALIEAAVDKLGDGYREVFMLRQVEGLSTAETAQVLGVQRRRREDPFLPGAKRAPARPARSDGRRAPRSVHVRPGPLRPRRGVRAAADRRRPLATAARISNYADQHISAGQQNPGGFRAETWC